VAHLGRALRRNSEMRSLRQESALPAAAESVIEFGPCVHRALQPPAQAPLARAWLIYGRVIRCIIFNSQLRRTWKCQAVVGVYPRLVYGVIRTDSDADTPRRIGRGREKAASAFPKITPRQTDSGIQHLQGAGERTRDQQRRRRLRVDRPQYEQNQRNSGRRDHSHPSDRIVQTSEQPTAVIHEAICEQVHQSVADATP
jgi:hypothetical protein